MSTIPALLNEAVVCTYHRLSALAKLVGGETESHGARLAKSNHIDRNRIDLTDGIQYNYVTHLYMWLCLFLG